jgi:hypothetical protein
MGDPQRIQSGGHLMSLDEIAGATKGQSIAQLDQRWMAWQGRVSDGARAQGLALSKERSEFVMGRAPYTLPSSIGFRADVISSLGPSSVLLLDDVDGLAKLLPESIHRASIPAEAVDCAVMSVADVTTHQQTLQTAMRSVRVGGHLVLSVFPPVDGVVEKLWDTLPLTLVKRHYETQHIVVPGGYCLDGGGELWVFKRAAGQLPPLLDKATAQACTPHYWLDLDGLDAEKLKGAGLSDLVEGLSRLLSDSSGLCEIHLDAQREVLVWFGRDGVGFSAELRKEQSHLLVQFTPYQFPFFYKVVCACLWAFGGKHTRSRPQRTDLTAQKQK